MVVGQQSFDGLYRCDPAGQQPHRLQTATCGGDSWISCASRVVPRFDIRALQMVYGPRSIWTENTVAGDATVPVIQRIALKESTLMVGKSRANNITRKKNESKIKRNIQNPPNKGVGAAATRTDISIHLSNITGNIILLLYTNSILI